MSQLVLHRRFAAHDGDITRAFNPLPFQHGAVAVVFDWEFCGIGRCTYDVAAFIAEAFPPQQRREEEEGLVRGYHSALVDNGVRGYPFEECWQDYRLSMLEVLVFWIVTGGYCNYEEERAAMYLRNTLERLDAAISDLASIETVGLS